MRELPVTDEMTCMDYHLPIMWYSLVTIVLSVLLRFTAVITPLGSLKLFLTVKNDSACMRYQL